MATLVIPLEPGQDVPPTVQALVLDGVTYQLQTRWNGRAGLWFLSLADSDGEAIADSLPIANSGLPINAAVYRQTGQPPGSLWAIALADPQTDAGATELGGRVVVTYDEATT